MKCDSWYVCHLARFLKHRLFRKTRTEISMDEIGAIPYKLLGKKNQNTTVLSCCQRFLAIYLKAWEEEEDLKYAIPTS